MTQAIFVSGGMHNVEPREFLVSQDDTIPAHHFEEMQRHCCNMADCDCGGFRDARLVDENGQAVALDEGDIDRYMQQGLEDVRIRVHEAG